MNKLGDLDKLISEVLGAGLVVEKTEKDPPVALSADKAMPAVPFPVLRLNDNWGRTTEGEGFDMKLFKLAGLGKTGAVDQRLGRLKSLVDCGKGCPTDIREIIARLSIMEMFSTVMNSFVESSKGFLFENFMALVLKGSTVADTQITDIEIMKGNLPSTATMPVSLKLLKDESAFHGSLKNLYKTVMVDGKAIVYIIGYKVADGSAVQLWYLRIDQKFFTEQPLSMKNKDNPKTLMSLYKDPKAKSQFTIYPSILFNKGRQVGTIPIYDHEQLRQKAEQLTTGINDIVTPIYENLNVFSQQLTKFYVEGSSTDAGGKARTAFTDLTAAVDAEKGLK